MKIREGQVMYRAIFEGVMEGMQRAQALTGKHNTPDEVLRVITDAVMSQLAEILAFDYSYNDVEDEDSDDEQENCADQEDTESEVPPAPTNAEPPFIA